MKKKELKKGLDKVFNIPIYSTEYLPHETYEDLFKRKLLEFVQEQISPAREESFDEGYMECFEDNIFLEHYTSCKKTGMDTITMAKKAKKIENKIDNIIERITHKAELDSLSNQSKDK